MHMRTISFAILVSLSAGINWKPQCLEQLKGLNFICQWLSSVGYHHENISKVFEWHTHVCIKQWEGKDLPENLYYVRYLFLVILYTEILLA